jgi:hypothetical protein
MPCHPISSSLTLNPIPPKESFFLLWLEEYLLRYPPCIISPQILSRLESRIYEFQPVDLTDPAIQLNPTLMDKRHAIKMVSLHPLLPLYNPNSLQSLRRNFGATIRVTKGVECVACPVFIPEKSNFEFVNSCPSTNRYQGIFLELFDPATPIERSS